MVGAQREERSCVGDARTRLLVPLSESSLFEGVYWRGTSRRYPGSTFNSKEVVRRAAEATLAVQSPVLAVLRYSWRYDHG